MLNIVIIGIGGIGSHLVRPLCRYLNASDEDVAVTLIDGDRFELKNEARQEFAVFGNKAEVLAEELSGRYPKLGIIGKSWYVTEENVFIAISDGDLIFLCVDNHATRNVLSTRCAELKNAVLISGGNEYSDGNVQIFIRKNGKDCTSDLIHYHPEIETPQDKNPGEMSCEELAQSGSPQLIFTNLLAAAWMLTTFWNYEEWRKVPKVLFSYSEICFDGKTGNARSINRS